MSDKELIDEVLTLIVAGHETTAAALTWTWYLISQHPETRRSSKPRRTARHRSSLGSRRRRVARFHSSSAAGGAAPVSPGLAVHAPHARSG
jgi:cytochrome P450